jgi:two-component system LytT family response regulator
MYTCIIVEDEELPRLSLKSKLEDYHSDIEIVAMCADAESALESILRHKPQLLFLDIQLPGENAIWLLEQLQQVGKMPQVIFTTAYTDSEYLLKAIKISAADYLNKPISIVELAQAIEKVKKRIRDEKEIRHASQKNVRSFRTLYSQLIASDEDIVYIEADGNYAQIQLLHDKKQLIFERLGDIEKRLDNPIFIRVGRSLIINRNYIRKLNTKDCICSLVTPDSTYHLPIPKGACDMLSDLCLRHEK